MGRLDGDSRGEFDADDRFVAIIAPGMGECDREVERELETERDERLPDLVLPRGFRFEDLIGLDELPELSTRVAIAAGGPEVGSGGADSLYSRDKLEGEAFLDASGLGEVNRDAVPATTSWRRSAESDTDDAPLTFRDSERDLAVAVISSGDDSLRTSSISSTS